MAAKYPENPIVMQTTNGTGGALSAGDTIVCGDGIRILAEDLANGVSGAAYAGGKFTSANALAANSALSWSDGAALFWDSANAYLTNSASGNTFAGWAAGAKTVGQSTAGLVLGSGAPTSLPSASVSATKLAFWKGGSATVAADDLVIPVTKSYVAKTTGADAEALSLANGTAGQVLTISLVVDGGGDGTLAPTTCSGFVSIVFADAGDTVTLLYVDDTVGWVIIGAAGVAAPPVIALS